MVTTESVSTEIEIVHNEFARLQLEIARLADELAKSSSSFMSQDREIWLEAEREIFARYRAVNPIRAGT